MLSAKKEENRVAAVPASTTLSTSSAVGKVVNSIQGLQQQLNDYTLEEITDAETKAKTLLLRLSELQSRLKSLANIKRNMNAAHHEIEDASAEDFDVTTLETTHKPLRVQEIVQASNLIRFPGINRFAAQSVEPIAPDTSVSEEIFSTVIDKPEPTRNIPEAHPGSHDPERAIPCNEPAFIFEPAGLPSLPAIAAEEFAWSEEPADTLTNIALDKPIDDVPNLSRPLPDASQTTDPETTMGNLEQTSQIVPTQGDEPIVMRWGKSDEFDQRLLDDLIKNYGEIFTSADSSTTVKPQFASEIRAATETMPVEIQPVAETKETRSRQLPLKKEGEIDRELKKIIKDYGEYDIYSRQSPINLKLGVIGAFLLLGAVFSGFYFFSSPKPLQSSSQTGVAQPISMPSGPEMTGQSSTPQPHETRETSGAASVKTHHQAPALKK